MISGEKDFVEGTRISRGKEISKGIAQQKGKKGKTGSTYGSLNLRWGDERKKIARGKVHRKTTVGKTLQERIPRSHQNGGR